MLIHCHLRDGGGTKNKQINKPEAKTLSLQHEEYRIQEYTAPLIPYAKYFLDIFLLFQKNVSMTLIL